MNPVCAVCHEPARPPRAEVEKALDEYRAAISDGIAFGDNGREDAARARLLALLGYGEADNG